MALKTYNPTSPGRRHLIQVDKSTLWKGKPVKMLVEGLTKTGGRNSDGRITSRHIGGGAKRAYRRIDFRRRKFDAPASVEGGGMLPVAATSESRTTCARPKAATSVSRILATGMGCR